MENINKRLKELQPHVISIRFPNGLSVVDVSIKDGWSLPKSNTVGFELIKESGNFYMLYPLMTDGKIGVNELLDYVDDFIKVNLEREEKVDLLKIKIKELQDIFIKSSLNVCKTLKFTFSENKEMFDYSKIELPPIDKIPIPKKEGKKKPNKTHEPKTIKNGNVMVELPPKKGDKIILEEFDVPDIVCKCGPNEMCPICENEKR